MCMYCRRADSVILDDIINRSIYEEALVRDCAWRRICQVRGRNFNRVDYRVWTWICTERGYLRARENPRGF